MNIFYECRNKHLFTEIMKNIVTDISNFWLSLQKFSKDCKRKVEERFYFTVITSAGLRRKKHEKYPKEPFDQD